MVLKTLLSVRATKHRNEGQKGDVEQSHKPCLRWNAEAAAPSGSFVLGPSRQAASSPWQQIPSHRSGSALLPPSDGY